MGNEQEMKLSRTAAPRPLGKILQQPRIAYPCRSNVSLQELAEFIINYIKAPIALSLYRFGSPGIQVHNIEAQEGIEHAAGSQGRIAANKKIIAFLIVA